MTRRALIALVAAPAWPQANRIARLDTDKRIESLLGLSQANPSNRTYSLELGFAYLQKLRESGDGSYMERAAAIADKLLSSDGQDPGVLRLANELDMLRHEFRKVADRAGRMVQVRSMDAGTWGNLGDALMELGEYSKAFEAYSKMLALRPSIESYSRIAWHRFVTGDAPMAISLLRTGIEAGSRLPEPLAWCHAELGDLLWKTGQTPAAAQSYRTSIDTFPRTHRAHAGLARVLEAEDNLPAAVESYARAAGIVPLIEYHAALARIAGERKQAVESKKQWQMVDAIHKLEAARGEKANRVLAILYVDAGRNLPQALALAEAELANRNDVYTFDALAWVHHKLGHKAEASQYAAKAIALDTPEPSFHFHAGVIVAATKPAEARKHLERALALNPKFDRQQSAEARRLLAALVRQDRQ